MAAVLGLYHSRDPQWRNLTRAAKRSFKPFGQPEKIRWLWRKLGEAGGIQDTSDKALAAFVSRTTGMGVADVRFLPTAQASTVIEALKSWLGRVQRAQA
ncbi:phage protein GemA/Gp16 family protein [Ottowia sp.]|uniref:phage protein GemA/Gp16 family protein n=1 Tax=Ottowia sp. TaxID=1898956 RepID=UPI0039E4CD81